MDRDGFFRKKRQNLSKEFEIDRTIDKMPSPVYYVKSDEDDTVLVGMDVTAENCDGNWYVSWYDTTRTRMMKANMVVHDQENDTLVFRRSESVNDGAIYRFSPMTLKVYDSEVKQKLWNPAEFTDVDDMDRAFLNTMRDDV